MTAIETNLRTLLGPLLSVERLGVVATVVAIVVVGWLLALGASALVRRLLRGLGVNRQLESGSVHYDLERAISVGVYYAVLLLALVAAINALDLPMATEPLRALLNPLFGYVPNLVGAALLALFAWVIATISRTVLKAALAATKLDDRLEEVSGAEPMSTTIAQILYYFVFLAFLPGILGALGLQGLFAPFEEMLADIMDALPNVLGAIAIGFVGWIVAYLLGNLTTTVIQATPADASAERSGIRGFRPSGLAGVAVRVIVFVPALIAALDALRLEAISGPAIDMLGAFVAAIPQLVAAALILAVAWLVAKVVAPLVVSALSGLGSDALPERIGVQALFGEATLSDLGGKLTTLGIVLFAALEAARRLGFEGISAIVGALLVFGGRLLLGATILTIGIWLANLAAAAVQKVAEGQNHWFLAQVARVAILGIVIAMGLAAIGVADTVVNLAFGLTFGSVAVAVALAFGLGGREAAARLADRLSARMLGEA